MRRSNLVDDGCSTVHMTVGNQEGSGGKNRDSARAVEIASEKCHRVRD